MESDYQRNKESLPLLINIDKKLIDNSDGSIENKQINLKNNIKEVLIAPQNNEKIYGKLEDELEIEIEKKAYDHESNEEIEKEKNYKKANSIDKDTKNNNINNNNDRKGNIKNTINSNFNTNSENDKLILNDNKFTILSDTDKDKEKFKTIEAETIKNRVKFNLYVSDFDKKYDNNNHNQIEQIKKMNTIRNSIGELKSLTKRQLKRVSKINDEKDQLNNDINKIHTDKFSFKKNKSSKNFDTLSSKSNKQNHSKKNKRSFNHMNDN